MLVLRDILFHIGEYVRYGPNRISVNNTVALHAIYGTKANTQKSSYYSVFSHFFPHPSTETTIDKEHHAAKRRILSKALSERGLKDLEASFLANVEQLCSRLIDSKSDNETGLLSMWSHPRDLAKSMGYLAFDSVAEICFGQTFNTLENQENRFLIDVISDGAQALNIVSVIAKYQNIVEHNSACLLGGTYAVVIDSSTRSSFLFPLDSRARTI